MLRRILRHRPNISGFHSLLTFYLESDWEKRTAKRKVIQHDVEVVNL